MTPGSIIKAPNNRHFRIVAIADGKMDLEPVSPEEIAKLRMLESLNRKMPDYGHGWRIPGKIAE